MLENLRGSYTTRHKHRELEQVLRMRLALPAAGIAHLVELADALGEQAKWVEGAAILRAVELPDEQRAVLELRAKSLMANLN
jgi:hypothetical protein